MSEIMNAKIDDVSISMADHGCLTFFLILDGGSWGVSYGGYCIGHGYLGANNFQGSDIGLESMMRIMDAVGVEKWEDLKGKYVRVETNGIGSKITKIGNIIQNKWFDIEEFFNRTQPVNEEDNKE